MQNFKDSMEVKDYKPPPLDIMYPGGGHIKYPSSTLVYLQPISRHPVQSWFLL